MGKSECDCKTHPKDLVTHKHLNWSTLIRSGVLMAVILSLGKSINSKYITIDALTPYLEYVPSISIVLCMLIAIVASRTLFIGSCCTPSFQLPATAVRELVQTRDVNLETSILSEELLMAKRLSQAIQIPTISYDRHDPDNKTDESTFLAFHAFLRREYPLVFEHLQVEIINTHSLLFTWKGSDTTLAPYLLIAHLDVVPVPDEAEWTHPPFSGHIDDEYVWGRGAIDDKHHVIGYMESITHLLKSGFAPQRTIYIGFGHDEEISGFHGAKFISDHLISTLGVDCMEFMMDEGLFIVDGALPGHKKPVAMICVAEKGAVVLKLSIKLDGGHASVPAKDTAIGVLANAVRKLEQNPMPYQYNPAMTMLDSVSEGFHGPLKVIMTNLWLFSPIVALSMIRKHLTAVILRTTTALTIFKSGTKDNVLPNEASAVVNHRIHPEDSIESVIAWDRKIINDDRIKIEVLSSIDPSPVSDHTHPAFTSIVNCVHRTFKGSCSVAPGLFVANSDSRHYWNVTKQIYRFSPILLNTEEIKMFHGRDEKIRIHDFAKMVYFYASFIKETDARKVTLNK